MTTPIIKIKDMSIKPESSPKFLFHTTTKLWQTTRVFYLFTLAFQRFLYSLVSVISITGWIFKPQLSNAHTKQVWGFIYQITLIKVCLENA